MTPSSLLAAPGAAISPAPACARRYPTTIRWCATSVAIAAGFATWGAGVLAIAAVGTATAAAAMDVAERRLPDRWVTVTAGLALAWAVAAAGPEGLVVGSAAMALASVSLLTVHLAAPPAMGFGDVKFAAALAPLPAAVLIEAATGAGVVTVTMLAVATWLCIASGFAAVTGVVIRRRAVPFGPSLLAAAVVTTFAASRGVPTP